jgi:transcriptional regulator with XRE-family HTH domain
MKNTDLTKKIKELRTKMGLSQGQLAEVSQLNLRTVQRIENGETEPRGDSLKRLANALNVLPNDLIEWTEKEDKGMLIFLNLSALAFIVFPLMGVIVPLTIYMLKKDQVKNINETGKKLLNFQITGCLLIFLAYMLFICVIIFHISLPINFNISAMDLVARS